MPSLHQPSRLVRMASVAVTAIGLIGSLTACTSAGSSAGAGSSSLQIVASTSVYGAIAAQIAGDKVTVTSLISNPDADPHSYQASLQNRLAVSKANIVIENGGGYDDFVGALLAASSGHVDLLNVVSISGKTAPPGQDLNEHVWYDFPTMTTFAHRLAVTLASHDPADAATFGSNADRFIEQLQALAQTESAIKARYSGTGVAITEPVPLYMLQACGLANRTPPPFSAAVQQGSDVSPRLLAAMLNLLNTHQVRLLAYNSQTTGPVTDRVQAAAMANGIPVVPVTETLPIGMDYLGWMRGTLASIQTALSK